MILPDYAGGSIVNLMRTLAEACGATEPPPYAPLRGNIIVSPPGTARHVVLLVIDGLGHGYLQRHGAGGHLHAHLRGRLTSVFPSTTASAVTTFLSGLAPQQHALTGWHMYFAELGAVVAVLPLRPRGAGQFDDIASLPRRLFGHMPFVDRIPRRATFVSPRAIADSPFNRYHSGNAAVRCYGTLEELFGQMQDALRQADGPSFLHAYYSDLDTLAHAHGVDSPQVAAQFAALDRAFGAFLDAIADSDSIVLACADHGFIDSPPERQIDLARHPGLAATLARPLCGERRTVYCHVRPGHEERFESCAHEALGGCADLFSGRELIRRGWFGPGAADPRLASRIGDYVLVMRENWTLLDWVEGEKRYGQLGVHGGVSADEMFVPLIVAETR